MCLYIGGGTTGKMFCYQTDGPIAITGGGAYNRDITAMSFCYSYISN